LPLSYSHSSAASGGGLQLSIPAFVSFISICKTGVDAETLEQVYEM